MEKKFIVVEKDFLAALLYNQLLLEELESLGVDVWKEYDNRTISPEERNLEVEKLIAAFESKQISFDKALKT